MFEFIAHDKGCSKPDEVDRDVRRGQVTQDHDDHDDVCMYVCMYVCMLSSVVLANRWLVAADVWEVNTEAVFHCWCRVG